MVDDFGGWFPLEKRWKCYDWSTLLWASRYRPPPFPHSHLSREKLLNTHCHHPACHSDDWAWVNIGRHDEQRLRQEGRSQTEQVEPVKEKNKVEKKVITPNDRWFMSSRIFFQRRDGNRILIQSLHTAVAARMGFTYANCSRVGMLFDHRQACPCLDSPSLWAEERQGRQPAKNNNRCNYQRVLTMESQNDQ